MENVILIIHLILALSLIGLIMLQRSEGGGLGIGGGGGGLGSFASAGQTANALTRATAICAGLFFVTSLALGILAGTHSKAPSLLDSLDSPPPVSAPATDGSKPSTMPSGDQQKAGDENAEKVDSSAPTSDKDLPKASDEPVPQSGAPSAPISE